MTSSFETSLAAFDATLALSDLQQIRSQLPPTVNFIVFFRHIPTNRVFAHELTTNIWSDATTLRDWNPVFTVRPHFNISALR